MSKFKVYYIDSNSERIVKKSTLEVEAEDPEEALVAWFTNDDPYSNASDYDWLEEQLPVSTQGKISYCGNDDYRFVIVEQ